MTALRDAIKATFLRKAEAAWGDGLPPEVRALAERCDTHTAAAAAKAVGISPATVSHLIHAKVENHDLAKIYGKIRGALLSETVECPRKGAMRRDVCLQWQAKPFAATSADRVAMYRACRSGCPHSRLKEG
ncbi:transcriptional regulator [Methylobacterium aquaticum]|uniref:transcriptional regulator n=1 Tax=Methylobacterium aquaticum TaxID=270351 RepID=UPI003D163DE3